ncbi:alpha,alpha-trehalase [Marinobacterium rhizophilum]|uniref:Mannosylglycerate hydrolase MGH1-like glycoside hydrolase domain-containing protein n=1 Tax=Marinobacterium rhizophilum TaxID=420402 RepID=A0ABY5HFT3_9GAMM|nr:alpha,alpha-trehalase [Marinobacterium rhizophilum]UTW11217.1 hypothetical protein KDW95_18385 [Marinobacterium rhizophilum]
MNRPVFDIEHAKRILRDNDLGGYTVPTKGLYPFQWNWDAAITALGWMEAGDEPRAWLELEMLLKGQWDNGMVPHIIFHGEADTYFPGPEVWGVENAVKTSAISQPPVLATVVRILFEQSKDRALAEQKLAALLPGTIACHLWWYRERDPENTGLVCSYHPWESGMDNSPAWDHPLSAVPTVDWEYTRRDTGHVDAAERPHKHQYDRYIYLVDFFKRNRFDSDAIYKSCPYRVQDIGIIAILQRANTDLLALCQSRIDDDSTRSLQASSARTAAAINELWSDELSCFVSRDTLTGQQLKTISCAGVLPLFGELASPAQASAINESLDRWIDGAPFGLASTHPDSETFEPQRYWRGPSWLHINWMIALGLEAYQMPERAEQLKQVSEACLENGDFWEYYNSVTGEGCGGGEFSWTAAIALHWLKS